MASADHPPHGPYGPLVPARQPFPPRLPHTSANPWHQMAKDLWLTAPRDWTPCDWCGSGYKYLPFPACVSHGEYHHCANVTFWIGPVELMGYDPRTAYSLANPPVSLGQLRYDRLVRIYTDYFRRAAPISFLESQVVDKQKALFHSLVAALDNGRSRWPHNVGRMSRE